PQTFSRGNFSRSSKTVRNSAAAQNAAHVDPAGPAPTIATSKISIATGFEIRKSRIANHEAARFNDSRFNESRLTVVPPFHESDSALARDLKADKIVFPWAGHFLFFASQAFNCACM